MRVRVLFFGQLKEIVGCAEENFDAAENLRLDNLYDAYSSRFAVLGEFRESVAAAVNQQYASWDRELRDGDEVAFLPPVSGGRAAAIAADIVQITRARIPIQEIVAQLKAPEDGAVAVFEGIVRNHSRGKRTLYLEYEAYEEMALGAMRRIAGDIRQKFAIDRLAIVHRLGRMEIGEASVLIAVSAAHRGAAFDACRYGIDTLKKTAPIWKKEFFADGAVWAEGEKISVEAFSRESSSSK